MKWFPAQLTLSNTDVDSLKAINSTVLDHIENGGFAQIKPSVLKKLEEEMTRVIANQTILPPLFQKIDSSSDHHILLLQHSDNEILNLPWNLAKHDVSGQALGNIPRLYLTKSVTPLPATTALKPYIPQIAAPLKILIMISSPSDSPWKSVLSYDEEEAEILKAFLPLMESGDVEIDFTENGSLQALKEKIRKNNYHIVHFSGHGVFDNGEGYLELENPLDLKSSRTPGSAFAEALVANPDHVVPLVMLSSCQTAKGTTEKGLCGVTNTCLQKGIPAVIAMGMSIQDKYAAAFSAHFYRKIANRLTLAESFRDAVHHIREFEAAENNKNFATAGNIPLQWIIPNLYLSAAVEHVVTWEKKREPIKHKSFRFITNQNRIILRHDKNYQFVGRREDKAKVLPALFSKTPVLLKGQGGIGKTALAENLVQRLIAKDPKTYPFVFDETTKSVQAIEDTLKRFLTDEEKTFDFVATLSLIDKAIDKIKYLINEVSKHCTPVFVFDNLEDFQEEKGGVFAEEYAPLAEIMTFLCDNYHVILTCRYPVPEVPQAKVIDLNQAGFNDFWKKCVYLELKEINIKLRENLFKKITENGVPQRPEIEFVHIVKELYRRLGGNFRALEFFNSLYRENPEKIIASLGSIEDFTKAIDTGIGEIQKTMRKNLYFDELMGLLTVKEQQVLSLLVRFRIPVLQFALQLQLNGDAGWENAKLTEMLLRLQELTLIEMSMDNETELVYYYATPIVKDLLDAVELNANRVSFSHELAGVYHYHVCKNVGLTITELEEAFFHFYQSGNGEKINEIGGRISRFYYGTSLFRSAFHYCRMVYALLRDGTSSSIMNTTGAILQLFGDLGNALIFCEKSLKKYQEIGDRCGEGTTLNNIGQIYKAQGDYETALSYLEKSLAISHEIGDRSGDGTTLSNISQIYDAQGDYETALAYLEKSLAISQEIGDRSGEGTTLNNIGQIYNEQGDYATALSYYEKSLVISQEIGDKRNDGTTLNNISTIYYAQGDYAKALLYYEKSLTISQEIGDKRGEGTTLNNISQIYDAQGDYETALRYLEKSLAIWQEIGDRRGEGTTFNNISQIYKAQGDYETALSYLKKSLVISQEIGDRRGEMTTLHNMAMISYRKEDWEKYLHYEKSAYKLAQEIGEAQGLFAIGKILGEFLCVTGQVDKGFPMLLQAYQIGIKAGYPDISKLKELIDKYQKEL